MISVQEPPRTKQALVQTGTTLIRSESEPMWSICPASCFDCSKVFTLLTCMRQKVKYYTGPHCCKLRGNVWIFTVLLSKTGRLLVKNGKFQVPISRICFQNQQVVSMHLKYRESTGISWKNAIRFPPWEKNILILLPFFSDSKKSTRQMLPED